MNEISPHAAEPAAAKRLRNLNRARAIETIYAPRPAATIFPLSERFTTLYPFIAGTIGADTQLAYLEFGVWRGASIKRMAQLFTNPRSRFTGFDSFEGLPEQWGDKPTGTFSTAGEPPRIGDKRVGFVKGYFQNTVLEFITGFRPDCAVLIHFDADLYSSTLFLLATLWPHVREYYFLFDEFPGDEAIALHDFASAFPVRFDFLACTMGDGKDAPQQLFGRLKNTLLAP
jgi:hypothetical protein